MRLTEQYEYEDKIAQLETTIRNKEEEIKKLQIKTARFVGRTYTLLKYLLTDEEISAWYRLTKKN